MELSVQRAANQTLWVTPGMPPSARVLFGVQQAVAVLFGWGLSQHLAKVLRHLGTCFSLAPSHIGLPQLTCHMT
jgi:hypothetical protein